eukprot:s116_g16.t1
MLRDFPVEGLDMPRPLRSWDGEEHGLLNSTRFEKEQVTLDDVLLMRSLVLYIISEEVRKLDETKDPVTLFVEQPADPVHMPEVVTLWEGEDLEILRRALQLGHPNIQPVRVCCSIHQANNCWWKPRLKFLCLVTVEFQGQLKAKQSMSCATSQKVCPGGRLWMRSIAAALQQGRAAPELPEGAPEIEDEEEAESEDADDVRGELQAERVRRAEQKAEEERLKDSERKEGDLQLEDDDQPEGEEKKLPKVEVTRLCTPLPSKSCYDVLRAIIDMYMRPRSDGFVASQIHTDRGGEFLSDALDKWRASRTILRTYAPGDQPQCNGRVEASVQWVKARIRHMLHAADAPFSRWPLPCRSLNERLRLGQLRKETKVPPFLSEGLIRKKIVEGKEAYANTGEALYIGPSWVHHGRWIEREDGTLALARMVMHNLTTPPKDDGWIGLEDELAPAEVRRIRGKVALQRLSATKSFKEDPKDQEAGKGEKDEEAEEIEEENLKGRSSRSAAWSEKR